jgi:hypothetical protein
MTGASLAEIDPFKFGGGHPFQLERVQCFDRQRDAPRARGIALLSE